jgi:hypothetical protein
MDYLAIGTSEQKEESHTRRWCYKDIGEEKSGDVEDEDEEEKYDREHKDEEKEDEEEKLF